MSAAKRDHATTRECCDDHESPAPNCVPLAPPCASRTQTKAEGADSARVRQGTHWPAPGHVTAVPRHAATPTNHVQRKWYAR